MAIVAGKYRAFVLTFISHRRTLTNHLIPAFGKARLADIGTLEIQRFVLAKMESGLSWECADHYRNLLSKIFETAKMWGYNSGPNPAAGVELPEKTPVREKRILQLDEVPRLISVLNEPVKTMVWLALLTGLRIKPRIRKNSYFTPLLHRDLKPAGRKLGMPWLNWHTLRRTHATLFQVAVRDAQAQLGHSKMSTTLEIYTLPIPEQQRATVEKLSVLMANDGRKGQNSGSLEIEAGRAAARLAADSMR